jgi:DNA-binding PadR family transcriptional regulator
MHKLAPGSLYRLQLLAENGARFYQVSVYMRRLETLGLVVGTGQADPSSDSIEYRITDAGRAELEERYGPSSPKPERR